MKHAFRLTLLALAVLALTASVSLTPAHAQDEVNGNEVVANDDTSGPMNRRPTGDFVEGFSFSNASVSDTYEFIVRATGKIVSPRAERLGSKTFTLITDRRMDLNTAINRLFQSFVQNEIAVIETDDFIYLDDLDQAVNYPLPVLGPEDDVLGRDDLASFVSKVYSIRYGNAESIQDILSEMIPDWASLEVEETSNQLVLSGTIGLAQRIQKELDGLDRKPAVKTVTVRLAYANATVIRDTILNLYSTETSGGQGDGDRDRGRGGRRFNPSDRGQDSGQGPAGSGAGMVELRVEADTRLNSVTIIGDPSLVDEIVARIENEWDVDFGEGEETIIKIYRLQYRDVIRTRDILESLINAQSTGGAGQQGRPAQQPGGGGASGGETSPLANQFRFEADASANELIVIGQTTAAFENLNTFIEELDQPGLTDLPMIVELKHADAQELAQEINVLLAEPGQQAQLDARASDLEDFEISGEFGTTDTGTGTGGTGGTGNQAQQGLQFPWQNARPEEDRAPVSHLVGQVRVVPVFRRNALLLLGPPHYKEQIAEIVTLLDRPGRQVLVTAVIAEVEVSDALSLGVRFSRSDIFDPSDNQIGGSGELTGTEENILDNLFDTSVLDVNIPITVVLDLLKTETDVRVLSEPRIFTADNEQANFFDGQEIQFVQDSITDVQTGNLNQTFEFRPVGIVLSVRPRITLNRDIDLTVSLELSSLVPSATQAGGLIIDRRLTETRVVVKDGQTIVVSGILREQESDVKRKIPFLGNLPLLGPLFTSTDTENTRTELLAFIRPVVVDNPEENEFLNKEFIERGGHLLRPLQEQKDNPKHSESTLHDTDTFRDDLDEVDVRNETGDPSGANTQSGDTEETEEPDS